MSSSRLSKLFQWMFPTAKKPIQRQPARSRLMLECLEDRLAPAAVATLTISTRFLKSWVEAHYAERLTQALRREFPSVATAQLEVRSAARASACTMRRGSGSMDDSVASTNER